MSLFERLFNNTPVLKGSVEYNTSPMYQDAQGNYVEYDLSENVPEINMYKPALGLIFGKKFGNLALNLGKKQAKTIITNYRNQKMTPRQIEEYFWSDDLKDVADLPENYTGNRNAEETYQYIKDNNDGKLSIKSPIDEVIVNDRNIDHLQDRLEKINRSMENIKHPDLIIQERLPTNNKDYHLYFKKFNANGEAKPHYNVAKVGKNKSYYSTSYNLEPRKLRAKLNEGQIIYNNLPHHIGETPSNNILTNIGRHFKSKLFDFLMK